MSFGSESTVIKHEKLSSDSFCIFLIMLIGRAQDAEIKIEEERVKPFIGGSFQMVLGHHYKLLSSRADWALFAQVRIDELFPQLSASLSVRLVYLLVSVVSWHIVGVVEENHSNH